MKWRHISTSFVCISVVQAQVFPSSGLPEDLECTSGNNSMVWGKVKQRFRDLFAEPSGLFRAAPREAVRISLNSSISELKAAGAFDPSAGTECGFGRVILQMLNLALVEDPAAISRMFRDAEVIASPVLTVLLDIPWVGTALSGWPFFGILAQIANFKVEVLNGTFNNDFVDGLDDEPTRVFFDQIRVAHQVADLGAMAIAALTYLDAQSTVNVFGPLTALAAQSMIQTNIQERISLLRGIQKALRDVLVSVADLEVALSIRWPLWSMLHVGIDAISLAGDDKA